MLPRKIIIAHLILNGWIPQSSVTSFTKYKWWGIFRDGTLVFTSLAPQYSGVNIMLDTEEGNDTVEWGKISTDKLQKLMDYLGDKNAEEKTKAGL